MLASVWGKSPRYECRRTLSYAKHTQLSGASQSRFPAVCLAGGTLWEGAVLMARWLRHAMLCMPNATCIMPFDCGLQVSAMRQAENLPA